MAKGRQRGSAAPEADAAARARRRANILWWVVTLGSVVILRSFIVEPYSIPSGSMEPTVEIGDHLIVAKGSYGLRIPFTTTAQVVWATPSRGDIVVLLNNAPGGEDLLKRVVAIPGDRVRVVDGWLYLNGERTPVFPSERKCWISRDDGSTTDRCRTYVETLPGERSHFIYRRDHADDLSLLYLTEREVPPGTVFCMGDNRDESQDGRVWGFAPIGRLKGRAAFIGWSFSLHYGIDFSRWVGSLR